MSKQFYCQFIPSDTIPKSIDNILNDCPRQQIDSLLWSRNGYSPTVTFSMAYTESSLLLKYFVEEKYAIAHCTRINDLVYKDSCVEFFISFDNGSHYYNLEFNCNGVPFGAYGAGNAGRKELSVSVMEWIEISTQRYDFQQFTEWEIAIQIPFGVFAYDRITSLNNTACKANFYKCGDETPEPHYMSWNNIVSPKPDFHVPEFFGTINFN